MRGHMKRIAFILALLPSLASAQTIAFRVGKGLQLVPWASCATAVSKAAGSSLLCVDSSASNALKYRKPDGTTITLGAGGAGSTFASLYSATASDNRATVTSGGGGLEILDASSPTGADLFSIKNNGRTVTPFAARITGASLSSTIQTSGAPSPLLLLTPVAHTGLTAATEYHFLNVAASAVTTQWAGSGSFTQQRFVRFQQPGIAFTSATTVDDAANVHIAGAPTAGTNATLTNAWSLWIGSGESLFQRNITGSTVGMAALTLENRTLAGAGSQQYSPALVWSGNGWKTNATAASQKVQYAAQLVPIQGTANPDAALIFYKQVNGGGYSQANINGHGFFAQSEQAGLGTATTTSSTFADIGDGTTTGYATWTTPAITVSKTYMLSVNVTAFLNTGTQKISFQVILDGSAISGQPTIASSQWIEAAEGQAPTSWIIPVTLGVGTHTIKLQWKTTGGTMTVNTNCTLQYVISG